MTLDAVDSGLANNELEVVEEAIAGVEEFVAELKWPSELNGTLASLVVGWGLIAGCVLTSNTDLRPWLVLSSVLFMAGTSIANQTKRLSR